MSLMKAVLRSVMSQDSLRSPPPDINEDFLLEKKKKIPYKYEHIKARVDTKSPRLDAATIYRNLSVYRQNFYNIVSENMHLLTLIKQNHFTRGRVDCYWKKIPPSKRQYHANRVNFLKRTEIENKRLYRRIVNTASRVVPTNSLNRDWEKNRREIVNRAQCKFVLFPPVPDDTMEIRGFQAPSWIKRPMVHLTLKIRDGAVIGDLIVELFTDVTPKTCQLFLELMDGDQTGHGYVGTTFFRKVPNMYWSGGDVIYDTGFGCYAQTGLSMPIGAENFHFSHCAPGLLSMRVTKDDEMCGIFNITFKPLPQFDLTAVVFGRVIQPSNIYDAIKELGAPLHSRPIIEISAARRRGNAADRSRWVHTTRSKCGTNREDLAEETQRTWTLLNYISYISKYNRTPHML